ncbi:MAG: hypothetical protein FWE57_10335 [Chitinispirillia bacterium]|nr:hypothetical protein [Chitinispirillia bacterium]
MSEVIYLLKTQLEENKLHFTQKPILIGGMAMEYYGIRKSGADIDLVICDADYQRLSQLHPDNRKDIYGDLGVVIEPFEIWRSIALLDYDFYKAGAIETEKLNMLSWDRLLLTRVFAMGVEKYMNDLELMKEHCYTNFRNKNFLTESEQHIPSYKKYNGIVFGGKYEDDMREIKLCT